jgi:shikimate dehydrogenase
MHIDGTTGVVALLGHPVAHSKSPEMMNRAFQAAGLPYLYAAFDVAPEALGDAVRGLRALGVRGWNVTIPHKVAIMEWLDEVDETAQAIGAVNTVVNDNGRLVGYNTDGAGYLRSLREETGLDVTAQHVLIIGAGGAARAVGHALATAGVRHITVANRTTEKAEELAAHLGQWTATDVVGLADINRVLEETTLLVQSTSVGMYPHVDEIPIAPSGLHDRLIVSDLIYRPKWTRLLQEAKKRGARVHSGLGMLLYQAVLAFEHWTGRPAPVENMREVLEASLQGE